METRPYDVITFDCYGTLVDWRKGITTAFEKEARRDGHRLEAESVLRWHAEVEPAVQRQGYRPYREVLAVVAKEIAERSDWPITPERAGFLADSVGEWPVFADTNVALANLRHAGYQLGILSNIDDDLLAATHRQFTTEFDFVVSAQAVRSYKPAHRHFLEVRERIGDARWLHAAQSHYHDVVPARQLDIPVAWVNRLGEPPQRPSPDGEVADLRELVSWLERQAG